MIKIFYSSFANKLDDVVFSSYLELLPLDLRNRILRYRRWEDAQASLYGKLLLRVAFEEFGMSTDLDNLKFTEYGRPYIDGNFDFNISHSGSYVVCAVGIERKIGIDVEKVLPISINDLNNVFHYKEWENITRSANPYLTFYYYWTAKEAVCKAEGKGLGIDLNRIVFNGDYACLEKKVWYCKSVSFLPDYMVQIASDKSIDEVEPIEKWF